MTDATAMLKDLSQPWRPGELVKDAITRVAPLAGLTFTRAFDIWYGKARRVEASEIAQIAEAISKKNKGAVWREITDLKARLARLETIVAGSHAELGQPAVPAARPSLRVASGANRSAGGRG